MPVDVTDDASVARAAEIVKLINGICPDVVLVANVGYLVLVEPEHPATDFRPEAFLLFLRVVAGG